MLPFLSKMPQSGQGEGKEHDSFCVGDLVMLEQRAPATCNAVLGVSELVIPPLVLAYNGRQ